MREILQKLRKTLDIIKSYYIKIVKDKKFYIPFILFVVISYAFSIFNRTVFIDDMAQKSYYGDALLKLKGLRWGQYLIVKLLSNTTYTPFISRFLILIFLIFTVIALGSLLFFFDNKKDDVWKYSIFSSIFISYPLINSFFEYADLIALALEYFIVTFVLLYQVVNGKNTIKDIIFIGIVMSFVMAGYESLIFAYISEVFVVLFIKYVINNQNHSKAIEWLKEGFSYAIPLFVALALRFIIGYGILLVFGLEYAKDGNTAIHWLSDGFSYSFIRFIFNGYYYILRGLSYFPITEFVICLILFVVITIKYQKNSKHSIILGLLLVLSLFFLSLISGDYLGYRTAQTVHIFVCFVIFLLFDELKDKTIFKHSIKPLLICLLLFVCYRQSISLHTYLSLNNQRSDNEAYIAKEIGYKLYTDFDTSKTVIFCGKYDMGSFINKEIYPDENSIGGRIEEYLKEKYGYDSINVPVTASENVFSTFNWAEYPFLGQNMIGEFLSYYGFDINISKAITYEQIKEYTKIAENNNMKTFEIRDFGDYILVYLGPETKYTNWNS